VVRSKDKSDRMSRSANVADSASEAISASGIAAAGAVWGESASAAETLGASANVTSVVINTWTNALRQTVYPGPVLTCWRLIES
jgi:hypothetical protein